MLRRLVSTRRNVVPTLGRTMRASTRTASSTFMYFNLCYVIGVLALATMSSSRISSSSSISIVSAFYCHAYSITSRGQKQQTPRTSLVAFVVPPPSPLSPIGCTGGIGSSSSSCTTSSTRRLFPDDMYDGGQYYDGEYNFDDELIDERMANHNEQLKEEDINKDPLNADLHRWFEDRNRPQPILLTGVLGDDESDGDAAEAIEEPLIPVEDFKWFEPTLRELELKYDKRREQLNLSLDMDRLATPLTVPENANEMLQLVLQEEMEKEIKQALEEGRIRRQRKRERRAQKEQQLQLEHKQQAQNDAHDPKVARKLALQRVTTASPPVDPVEAAVTRGIRDDRLALIDHQVKDMRARLEKQKDEKLSNYGDWKKYQEIKTIAKEQSIDGKVDEEEVRRKFLDWKAFMARQELTMEAFQQEEKEIGKDLEKIRKVMPEEKQEFTDVVANINRKALQALEDVLEKRQGDGSNTEELQERINALRASLEAVNYVDVNLRPKKKKVKVFKDEPVDLTDVFPRQAKKLGKTDAKDQSEDELSSLPKKRSRREEFASAEKLFRQDLERNALLATQGTTQVAQLDANMDDYEDDDYDEDDEDEYYDPTPPPPPKTAFFATDDLDDDEDDANYKMSQSDINKAAEERSTSLLGTYEEQRLENLFRQGKANTMEQRDQVKRSFEEFQRYQEEMMKKYEAMDETSLGYDISEVLTEDGDIDSAKVLSYLKSKPLTTTVEKPSVVEDIPLGVPSTSVLTEEVALDLETTNKDVSSTVEKTDAVPVSASSSGNVSDDLNAPKSDTTPTFIGKSDINAPAEERTTALLGTYEEQRIQNLFRETGLKEKEEQDKFKQQYLDFQSYQEEKMRKFEEEANANATFANLKDSPKDDVDKLPETYVERAKSSTDDTVELGPKPSLAERKRRLSQGLLWKEPEPVVKETVDATKGSFLGQAEVGMDSSSDEKDDEEDEDDFERNKRRIEEALGIKRPKGIDILDALGRKPGDVGYKSEFAEDDYRFPVRKSDVDLSSYHSRKSMLLERNALSIMEVNTLMDLKDDVEMEGVSPYMARINKPFREFGAIFRLEGVLVDISELEFRAWYKVAADLKLKPPSKEEARLASVQTGEYAVRRIFYWTNDYIQCREIGKIHSEVLNQEVKEYLATKAAAAQPYSTEATVSVDESSAVEENREPITDATDVLMKQHQLTKTMYLKFAEKYNYRKPTSDELDLAALLSPAEAVDLFEWERSPGDNILVKLKEVYDKERRARNAIDQSQQRKSSQSEQVTTELDDIVLVDGAVSWISALLDVEMGCGIISYLDDEAVNLIMESTGLATLIPADKRVTASSGYDRDTYQQLGASLRIDRRPDMCVVFDGNSDSLMAARDNEMKSIGMTSIYPSYELLAADTTARNYEYLTAMNIRRLFGERDNQEPMLMLGSKEPDRPLRKVMTIYPDDDVTNDGSVAREGYENDDYDDYSYDDQNRYYGDEKYQPRYRDVPEDGVLYNEADTDSDLFQ